MKFVILQPPVSVNEMRKGQTFLTKKYKEFKESAAFEIAIQKPKMNMGKELTVSFTFYTKSLHKWDTSNMVKAVEDACTQGGMWLDDRYITTHILKKVKSDIDKIEVEIL